MSDPHRAVQAFGERAHSARAGRDEGARARLEAIARVLDSKWRFPGTTVRFGADAVLNLLPGVGLLAPKGLSAYLIWEARRLGVTIGTLLRMFGTSASTP